MIRIIRPSIRATTTSSKLLSRRYNSSSSRLASRKSHPTTPGFRHNRRRQYPNHRQAVRLFSTAVPSDDYSPPSPSASPSISQLPDINTLSSHYKPSEIHRLLHYRNVGIFAHVDAGKTTVTERMLALSGVIHSPGSVDAGNTVTDYLPLERERGITIQSAAIAFSWGFHNKTSSPQPNDSVCIHLIDTPGHVDFSVEVNRSVAVLDGSVLVVDAVAGVQAQTETVWRALTRPRVNNHVVMGGVENMEGEEEGKRTALPCLVMVNKMDKEGSSFYHAIQSVKNKLPGANPLPVQIPLFLAGDNHVSDNPDNTLSSNIVTHVHHDGSAGKFIGIVDLLHMRAVIYPSNPPSTSIEDTTPRIIPLLSPPDNIPIDPSCPITAIANDARLELIASLADVDEEIEEYYLMEEEPSTATLMAAIRRATIQRLVLPVLAGAALKGKGVELVLDGIADWLPSPLDRYPPPLTRGSSSEPQNKPEPQKIKNNRHRTPKSPNDLVTIGHPLHPHLLALAFKVVHLKGRGGSGDGRIVFARVYSGTLPAKAVLRISGRSKKERVAGMLALDGGSFRPQSDGICRSGDVCALVGLKSVVTGDTLLLWNESGNKEEEVRLSGVTAPPPVLTVTLEAESGDEERELMKALEILSVEDPSLRVEEKEGCVTLGGLGELHVEVTLERLKRDFGLMVRAGSVSVAYTGTVMELLGGEQEGRVYSYDRTIGGVRLAAEVGVRMEPMARICVFEQTVALEDPIVDLSPELRYQLELDDSEHDLPVDELCRRNDIIHAIVEGARGSLRRGINALGGHPMTNVKCTLTSLDAEGGLSYLEDRPGAARAAAAHAVTSLLNDDVDSCCLLEPTMSVEVTVPGSLVGDVVSDLSQRRGSVGDVVMMEDGAGVGKSLVRGEVPLVEILGYANALRSLTGGEGTFSAEYKGHLGCSERSESDL